MTQVNTRLSAWEKKDGVFSWLSTDPKIPDDLTFGKDDAPRMTHKEWRYIGDAKIVEVGAGAANAWYRRCALPECRIWAGPYLDEYDAVYEGSWHARVAHRTNMQGASV